MEVFGTDGIRDVAGQGRLSDERVVRVGRALARFLAPHAAPGRAVRVGIGRDPRPSGADLLHLLGAALSGEGVQVLDAGLLPTPAVAWLTVQDGWDLGIALSASHNAAEYNGIKPFLRGGRKLTEGEEREIERLMLDVAGDPPAAGRQDPVDGAARYVEATGAWLAEEGDLRGLRLVVDLSAGAASATAPPVLRALAADVVILHEAGSRPINEDCGSEHPDRWRAAVVKEGADAGLAFDGDADRVLVADASGEILDGDDALAILAQDRLERDALPGERVVGTVMANLGVEKRLASLGVSLERVPVGDRSVAERMRATGAAIGAEPSGHVVLERDGALIGDGLVAGVRLLQAARRRGRSLTALRADTPRYPQVLRNVRVSERLPLEEMPGVCEAIERAEQDLGAEGRVLVRYSGTEPLLRFMAEGRDLEAVNRAVEHMIAAARPFTSA